MSEDLMLSENKQFKYDNDKPYEEHEEGNAVDAMHVLHPFGMRSIGISFLYVEVFGQLSQYAHNSKLSSTQNYDNICTALQNSFYSNTRPGEEHSQL